MVSCQLVLVWSRRQMRYRSRQLGFRFRAIALCGAESWLVVSVVRKRAEFVQKTWPEARWGQNRIGNTNSHILPKWPFCSNVMLNLKEIPPAETKFNLFFSWNETKSPGKICMAHLTWEKCETWHFSPLGVTNQPPQCIKKESADSLFWRDLNDLLELKNDEKSSETVNVSCRRSQEFRING